MKIQQFEQKKIKSFYFVNISCVLFLEILFILFFNSSNDFDFETFKIFLIMLLISVIIILLQYPLLLFFKNWIYKGFVFYFSMILFLFIFGVLFEYMENVSVKNLLESGLKSVVLGQIFGGLFMYLFVLILN